MLNNSVYCSLDFVEMTDRAVCNKLACSRSLSECVCVLMADFTCGALISQRTTGVQPHLSTPDSN